MDSVESLREQLFLAAETDEMFAKRMDRLRNVLRQEWTGVAGYEAGRIQEKITREQLVGQSGVKVLIEYVEKEVLLPCTVVQTLNSFRTIATRRIFGLDATFQRLVNHLADATAGDQPNQLPWRSALSEVEREV